MRTADAPTAGWYPDPQGGPRLRWWDGGDWVDQWRTLPSETYADAAAVREAAEAVGAARLRAVGQPAQAAAALGGAVAQRAPAVDQDQLIADMRRIARAEVQRATSNLTDAARETTASLEATLRGLVEDWAPTVVKWLKRGVAIVVVLGVVLFLLQALGSVAQIRLLEWIGERIDGFLSAGVLVPVVQDGLGVHPPW